MYALYKHCPSFFCVVAMVGLMMFTGGPLTAQDANTKSVEESPQATAEPLSIDEHEFARLGIEVTDSPGVGVLVQAVDLGSPAEQVGIQPGDFVLSVDGQSIGKPADLVNSIKSRKPGTEVKIDLWRDGNESVKRVVLATSHDVAQPNGKAWLGVTLEANGSKGAKIAQVIAGSPAANANLSTGDLVVAIDETPVESAKDLVDAIEASRSGEQVTLSLGGDDKRTVQVTLGEIAQAPPVFSFRMPMPPRDNGTFEYEIPNDHFSPVPPWGQWQSRFPPQWQEQMTEMRKQIEQLHQQLDQMPRLKTDELKTDELKTDEPETNDQPQDDDDKARVQSLPDDAARQFLASPPVQFVDYRYDRNRYQHPRYGSQYRYRPPYYGYPYAFPPLRYGPRYYPYSSYYNTRPYYRNYYRPGVRVYVGPFGVEYYYR